jgi:glycosyltransferase involved in cell wall biosynthesis
MRRSWNATPEDIVVAYAGRLQPEKGLVEFIVQIQDLLRDGRNRIRLAIHGAGPERPRLERAIASLGLRGSVAFTDWVSPEKMPDVYRSADIVVLPSMATPHWSEQFGYNLAEAMSCARPIVAAATGEIPWVLGRGGRSYRPETDNVAAMVASLARDVQQRDALASAAREEAVARFSVDAAGQGLVTCFEKAVSQPKRR